MGHRLTDAQGFIPGTTVFPIALGRVFDVFQLSIVGGDQLLLGVDSQQGVNAGEKIGRSDGAVGGAFAVRVALANDLPASDAGAPLDRLKGRVEKLPKSDLTAELQQRLQSIDGQYQSTNKMMDQLQNMSDPRSLLKLQVEMYQITQNLEMVSKAVEQVNSGVKQVMQTQV